MNDDSFKFYVEQQREQHRDIKADIKALEIKVDELQHFKSKLLGMSAIVIVVSELVILAIERMK